MIEQVREQLLPLLDEVIESLDADRNDVVALFFAGVRTQLLNVDTEVELMAPFLQLAGTAPVVNAAGVDPHVLGKIDALLARAQELAHTLSASSMSH